MSLKWSPELPAPWCGWDLPWHPDAGLLSLFCKKAEVGFQVVSCCGPSGFLTISSQCSSMMCDSQHLLHLAPSDEWEAVRPAQRCTCLVSWAFCEVAQVRTASQRTASETVGGSPGGAQLPALCCPPMRCSSALRKAWTEKLVCAQRA